MWSHTENSRLVVALSCVIAIGGWPSGVGAQPLPTAAEATVETADEAANNGGEVVDTENEPASEGEFDLSNPRAMVRSFLRAAENRDYARASRAIEFASDGSPPDQQVRENVAFKLADVINSLPEFDDSLVSDNPEIEEVNLRIGGDDPPIELTRLDDGRWRFASSIVARIGHLHEQSTAQAAREIAGMVGTSPTDADRPATDAQLDAQVADMLDNARVTMRTFLTAANAKDYALAARTMDFSLLPTAATDAQRRHLAWRLKEVIDRMQWVDYARIPSRPDADTFRFPIGFAQQPIAIDKGPRGNWRFTRETVARVDDLYDQWKDKPRVTKGVLPLWLRTPWIAGNEGWRVVILFASIFTSLLVARIIRWTTQRSGAALERRRPLAATLTTSLGAALVPFVLWLGVGIGMHWIVLDDVVRAISDVILHVLLVLAVAYALYILVDVVDAWLYGFAEGTESKMDDMLAPLVRRSLRATIVILALVQIASILSDKPPATIVAGLGVASIAVGLAAQDTIKNVFGSVMLLTDRPFEVGDRIVVDGHDGPVETVGFRSTRIRTLEGHVVTVPNGELASRTIRNIGKRPHIRRVMNIGIVYDTPAEKIEQAVEIIKDILRDHEGMQANFPPRVFFDEFQDASLNVFVIYWYHPADYWAFCAFNERVNLDIFRRFEAEGIEFAFPTQTVFLAKDPNRPLSDPNQSSDLEE